MRYYTIVITDQNSGKEIRRYTSFANGKTNPNALNIELDIPVGQYALPTKTSAFVRIWGVSLKEISQASNLNNLQCTVFAGMQKGLPLANPKQSGLIVQGQIFQALGNWIDTDQTLDLILIANTGAPGAPKNIVLNWKKGTLLADAIKSTLSTAFPTFKQKVSINPKLVLQSDEQGYYQSLEQFAAYIKIVSQSIVGGSYLGVDITVTETTFVVDDGTTQSSPKVLVFQDFIGQPTWLSALEVQFKMVMRADLTIFDYVKFPPVIISQSPQANSPLVNRQLVFQGVFQIQAIRHVGNFRQDDAASWVTVFDAFLPVAA